MGYFVFLRCEAKKEDGCGKVGRKGGGRGERDVGGKLREEGKEDEKGIWEVSRERKRRGERKERRRGGRERDMRGKERKEREWGGRRKGYGRQGERRK